MLVFSYLNFPASQAFENSYLVQGLDNAGHRLSGAVYGIPGNRNVNGNLTDQAGRVHTFYGTLGCCDPVVQGETDDGYEATLFIVD